MPRDILSPFDAWRRMAITTLNCINEGSRASLGNQEKADYVDAPDQGTRKSRTDRTGQEREPEHGHLGSYR